jgi:hypothetical protein
LRAFHCVDAASFWKIRACRCCVIQLRIPGKWVEKF